MRTTVRWYRVERRQIGFVKFIFEGYDNLAVLTTVDARRAVVRVAVAPGGEAVVDAIVDGFRGVFDVVAIDDADGCGPGEAAGGPPTAGGGSSTPATREGTSDS